MRTAIAVAGNYTYPEHTPTNGVVYWFYTDLDASNKMDEKPFFEFNMLDIRESSLEELKKFSKSVFDLNYILNTASELKYTREIKRLLLEQMQEPVEEFVRFFVTRVYSGRITQAIRDQFTQLTKLAFKHLLNDQINARLKTALASDPIGNTQTVGEPAMPTGIAGAGNTPTSRTGGVTTTAEELEAYYIVRTLLHDIIPAKRITLRDVQSYCGILLDDNNRKPICRLHFNGTQKSISFFNTEKEERVPLGEIDDLYTYVERLKAAVLRYDAPSLPLAVTTEGQASASGKTETGPWR